MYIERYIKMGKWLSEMQVGGSLNVNRGVVVELSVKNRRVVISVAKSRESYRSS